MDIQQQKGLKPEEIKYDEYWAQREEKVEENSLQANKDRHLKQLLQSRSAQVIVRTPRADQHRAATETNFT